MFSAHSSVSCFLIILISWTTNSASEDDPVVATTTGPIKGKLLSIGSGSVTAFLGIPYAEPPVGKLRLQKPRAHQPWSHILEAYDYGNACPQYILTSPPDADKWAVNRPLSEDCLFLNIWAPHPQPSTSAPVLVWIHGGGYFTGTGSLDFYNGASLAATENVIVVSMNYRLGALGFLYLPPAVPGNMGMWDQQLALTWVKENAAAFGGDPNRVTILGHSSGGASAGFHLLSPKSESLFAYAALQSGVPDALWAWMSPEQAKQRSLEFSQQLGCKEGNESEIMTCLWGKNATKFPLDESYNLEKMNFLMDLPFLPTTDGDFLPDDPQKLLEMGRIQLKPTLVGFSSDEASVFAVLLFPGSNHSIVSWEQLLQVIRRELQNVTDDVAQAIALKYTEDANNSVPYRLAVSHILADYYFVCPAAQFAAKMREAGSPVYTYSFTHHTSGSVWPEWAGAPHGAEVPYVFGTLDTVLAVNQTYTKAEVALSRRVMRYWAEFARSGNPMGSEASEEVWPLYNATQKNFIRLNTEPAEVLQLSPARHCDLLKRLSGNPKT
ncbi:acetylcholinesterase-like isoform X2 [Sceloporus undulatus]|uniref:acetylcholinesterase-like isoform X2 n=1 Tax=Sceloporus undulatus TaxID=8520 RepID=UPI001C4D7F35|nr:acetylcholinesterase-like isoform X2 [Sceloporus undulatus]